MIICAIFSIRNTVAILILRKCFEEKHTSSFSPLWRISQVPKIYHLDDSYVLFFYLGLILVEGNNTLKLWPYVSQQLDMPLDLTHIECNALMLFSSLSLRHVVSLTLGRSRDKVSNSTTMDLCANSNREMILLQKYK